MNTPTRVALVELVTHTSTGTNGANFVLRKREVVRVRQSAAGASAGARLPALRRKVDRR